MCGAMAKLDSSHAQTEQKVAPKPSLDRLPIPNGGRTLHNLCTGSFLNQLPFALGCVELHRNSLTTAQVGSS